MFWPCREGAADGLELGVHAGGKLLEEAPVHQVTEQDVLREQALQVTHGGQDCGWLQVHEHPFNDDEHRLAGTDPGQFFAQGFPGKIDGNPAQRIPAFRDREFFILVVQ
ncbi:hypothetical protein D3C83_71860 [compost metagenome]